MIVPDDAQRPSHAACAQAEQTRELSPPGCFARALGEHLKPGWHSLETKQQGAP